MELFSADRPLLLESGRMLGPVEVAYETWGALDLDRANAVVVCHALTGDSRATGEGGWWPVMVGPGRPVDPARHHVVCANILGGCRGTTGPSSPDPATGRPYGLRFPMYTVADQVAVHRALCRHLGIERPLAAIGGSLGGMQALHWALAHPGELRSGRAHLRDGPALGPEHRLQRGGPPGDHARPRLPRGRLRRRRAAGRARRGPDAGPHHLPVRARGWSASSGAGRQDGARRG